MEAIEPAIAGLVALDILWAGWGIIKESMGGLMNTALPKEKLVGGQGDDRRLYARRVRSVWCALPPCRSHDLPTDSHLVLDGAMTVDASHAICNRVKAALKADHPDDIILTQVGPPPKRKCATMEIA